MTSELAVRISWSLARLGELVNEGRRGGWLAGDVLTGVGDADAILSNLISDGTPMQSLAEKLGLSTIELDVLWLLACIEIEPVLAEAARCLCGSGMHELNVQVVERLCHGFVDLGRLARHGLVEMSSDSRTPRYRRPIRAADRVVELARGRLELDREIDDLARLEPPAALAPRSADSRGVELDRQPLVVAFGASEGARVAHMRSFADQRQLTLLVIRTEALAVEHDSLVRQLRAVARECRLHAAVPLLVDLDRGEERVRAIEDELFVSVDGPVLATCREACTSRTRSVIATEVRLPDREERASMWRSAMPEASSEIVAAAAERYRVSSDLIDSIAKTATAIVGRSTPIDIDVIHSCLRTRLEGKIVGLAKRVTTKQTWDDLVLPVEQFDTIVEIVSRARHRSVVFEQWGFGDKVGRGVGLAALLSGPPGTGKTMIAGLLARELGLDLYQVDLSRVVSKYIGETEKQLSALFDAAEAGQAILLFDEADSLFGKRTDVRSSNDRYANLEVNYLLQRMESFTGISLLTTNHEAAVDPAFLRRLAFHVRIPLPERDQRARMWLSMIPDRAEVAEDLDVSALADEFTMSGGYIKNAAVRAAFLAADEGTPIANTHLIRAARAEYDAMGKISHHAIEARR